MCVQKWQLEHHRASNYYFYYQKVVLFVTKIAFLCFLWISSGQNYTLNFVDATCKCENRPTSENTLLVTDFYHFTILIYWHVLLQYATLVPELISKIKSEFIKLTKNKENLSFTNKIMDRRCLAQLSRFNTSIFRYADLKSRFYT